MKNKIIYSIALLTVAVTVGAFSAYATEGKFMRWGKNFDPEKKAERQADFEAVKTAIENNDYQAWLEATADHPKMSENITEENFAKFVEMHSLMAEGKYEEARAISEELGIKRGFGGKFGHKGQFREFKDVNGDGVCNYQDFEQE